MTQRTQDLIKHFRTIVEESTHPLDGLVHQLLVLDPESVDQLAQLLVAQNSEIADRLEHALSSAQQDRDVAANPGPEHM